MRRTGTLAFLMTGVASIMLTVGACPASAAASKCTAAKLKCVGKKECGLLACHAKAETKGVPVDPACLAKPPASFSSCFAKAEAKPPCNTNGDEAVMEAKTDAFVLDVVTELDPAYPAPVQNKCSAAKKKCACKKANAKLACYSKAVAKGLTVDPACLAKAEAAFSKCFLKAESKPPCLTTGDTAAMEAKIDAYVADVATELGASPSGAFLD